MDKWTNASFVENQIILCFTIVKNKVMAGLDDDLMDEIITQVKKEVEKRITNEKSGHGVELVFNVINYCVDGAMLFLSFLMMDDYDGAYPLIFCLGLIIWLGYRMLSFKRNRTVDIILGFFLFVSAVVFYIFAILEDSSELVGRILIPIVYLGYFCAWGAIRRKDKENDVNDK